MIAASAACRTDPSLRWGAPAPARCAAGQAARGQAQAAAVEEVPGGVLERDRRRHAASAPRTWLGPSGARSGLPRIRSRFAQLVGLLFQGLCFSACSFEVPSIPSAPGATPAPVQCVRPQILQSLQLMSLLTERLQPIWLRSSSSFCSCSTRLPERWLHHPVPCPPGSIIQLILQLQHPIAQSGGFIIRAFAHRVRSSSSFCLQHPMPERWLHHPCLCPPGSIIQLSAVAAPDAQSGGHHPCLCHRVRSSSSFCSCSTIARRWLHHPCLPTGFDHPAHSAVAARLPRAVASSSVPLPTGFDHPAHSAVAAPIARAVASSSRACPPGSIIQLILQLQHPMPERWLHHPCLCPPGSAFNSA